MPHVTSLADVITQFERVDSDLERLLALTLKTTPAYHPLLKLHKTPELPPRLKLLSPTLARLDSSIRAKIHQIKEIIRNPHP